VACFEFHGIGLGMDRRSQRSEVIRETQVVRASAFVSLPRGSLDQLIRHTGLNPDHAPVACGARTADAALGMGRICNARPAAIIAMMPPERNAS
jgi:hypothetical protein